MLDDRSTPEYRYGHDVKFKQLVDLLTHFVWKADFTPSEVREAALLACIHYESMHLRHLYLNRDQFNMSDLDALAPGRKEV